MLSQVRRDILRTLKQSILYLRQKSTLRLDELSDHALHTASIFQDEDSLSIAVVTYALSKLIKRDGKVPEDVITLLGRAKEALTKKSMKEYSGIVREITRNIEAVDKKMNLYIQKVINNAEIKKGSRLYEQGISLSRAAEMLGLSQWEMMRYVGNTSIVDRSFVSLTDFRKRIVKTRKLFSSRSSGILVFDTGPIITLTMNSLLWLLDPLKKLLGGQFLISPAVRRELVDNPLETKKFKFEALHTYRYIRKKTLKVYEKEDYLKLKAEIESLCNSCFIARGNPIRIMHDGEIETIAIAIVTGSMNLVVDERTTLLLVENPLYIPTILGGKLKFPIDTDRKKLARLKRLLSGLNAMRSVELVSYAYEAGLLDRYLPERPYSRLTLLDAVLWGLKLNGCAVSEKEIIEIMAYEGSS